MPTYKNNTGVTVFWQDAVWAPGETAPSPNYIPESSGLTLVSETPVPKGPIILSEDYTTEPEVNMTVTLPCPEGDKYNLSLLILSEYMDIMLGSGPSLRLTTGTEYRGTLSWGRAPRIVLYSPVEATVRVLMEEVY